MPIKQICLILIALTMAFANDEALAGASDCQAVDLRHQYPDVHDQEDLRYCSSFVAADLASANLNKRFSHLEAAIRGGYAEQVWGRITSGSIVVGGKKIRTDQDQTRISDLYSQSPINTLIELAAGTCIAEDAITLQGNLKVELRRIEDLAKPRNRGRPISEVEFARVLGVFPEMTLSLIDEVRSQYDERDFLYGLLEASCKPRPNTMHIEEYGRFNKNEMMLEKIKILNGQRLRTMPIATVKGHPADVIHHYLGQNVSVGIGFNTKVFTASSIWRRMLSVVTEVDGDHAAIIVGRHWNEDTQSCHFIIRNSWGESSSAYRFPSEGGNVFVPEEELYPYLKSIYVVRPLIE